MGKLHLRTKNPKTKPIKTKKSKTSRLKAERPKTNHLKTKTNPLELSSKSSIDVLLKLTYEEAVEFLLQKYGPAKGPYFCTPTMKTKNAKISRTNEGLYVHHIDEDKAIMLSTSEYARQNPWEWQGADRLVYCTILEHLVLHIKIMQYPNPWHNENELPGYGGIVNFLIPELNDIFSGIKYKQAWQARCALVVSKQKEYYLQCIKYLVTKIGVTPAHLIFTSYNNNALTGGFEQYQITLEKALKVKVPADKKFDLYLEYIKFLKRTRKLKKITSSWYIEKNFPIFVEIITLVLPFLQKSRNKDAAKQWRFLLENVFVTSAK